MSLRHTLSLSLGVALSLLAQVSLAQVVTSLGDQVGPAKPNYSLVGLWVGVSHLDEEKLEAKYKQLTDPAQQKEFVQAVETFLSLAVAVQYQADGGMESDAEITDLTGESIRETVSGQWRVVETKGLKLIVEIHERSPDGRVTTTRKLLQFYEDGEHLATPVETCQWLADLNPLLVFERIPPEVAAEMQRLAVEQQRADAAQQIDR